MRFTGRIRLGDGQDADLDVTVEVDDTHLRFVSGEESLGSWCLADVVANRLVANEFEIELEGETVTFLADDQINFAYGAVQKMAEGWARYHAMNVVRRRRAVASARRHNEPNRLETVRRAFASARHELRRPVEGPVAPIVESADLTVEQIHQPTPAGVTPLDTSAFWNRVEQATAAEALPEADEVGGEDENPPPSEPLPGPTVAGRLRRLNALPSRRPVDMPPEKEAQTEAPVPAPAEPPAPTASEATPQPVAPEPAPVRRRAPRPPEPQPEPPEVEPVPEAVEIEPQPEAVEMEPQPEPPVEPADVAAGGRNGHPRQPVGVGAYRDGHHPAETSGLRASLRSIFSRSNEPHEHSFVESTTAGGITRRVCLECGHVSIGVSE